MFYVHIHTPPLHGPTPAQHIMQYRRSLVVVYIYLSFVSRRSVSGSFPFLPPRKYRKCPQRSNRRSVITGVVRSISVQYTTCCILHCCHALSIRLSVVCTFIEVPRYVHMYQCSCALKNGIVSYPIGQHCFTALLRQEDSSISNERIWHLAHSYVFALRIDRIAQFVDVVVRGVLKFSKESGSRC